MKIANEILEAAKSKGFNVELEGNERTGSYYFRISNEKIGTKTVRFANHEAICGRSKCNDINFVNFTPDFESSRLFESVQDAFANDNITVEIDEDNSDYIYSESNLKTEKYWANLIVASYYYFLNK